MTETNHKGQLEESTGRCTNTSCCPPAMPTTRLAPKVGRNDPCPCGNGRVSLKSAAVAIAKNC